MSDPIAAAEAAGKARDIANRFETAVFLIAYGIAEKDGLYEADPHRYPYSQAFRHGMNILAALCAECSDDAEELLPTFNESDFIRNSAASDVREWTARWRDECREAVEGCRSIEIGPLARLADKERPAPHVYFADAAFRGGDGKLSFRTLEELGAYMERLMHDSDQPEVAKALYGPFYESFRKGIGNVGL